MKEVVVYGKPNCPNCNTVKNILNARSIEFDYIDVTEDQDALTYVKEQWAIMKRSPSAPAVKMNGVFIGGVQDVLRKLNGG